MSAPLLEVEKISRAFGHFVAVNNVSLAISERRITALIGPNGAGKTTLYNMISGRLKPTAGSVRFRGNDITGISPDRIVREGISRSFQITNIFDELTVLENIQVALIARHNMGLNLWQVSARDKSLDAQAIALLARLGLESAARTRAGTLSHGEKRRVELAIVLTTEPQLVLLDEPTAGMTPEETYTVMQLIRSLADSGPYTFFLTEHDMDVVFGLAEEIFVMHRGELLAQGTPEAIRNDPNVRTAYLGEERP